MAAVTHRPDGEDLTALFPQRAAEEQVSGFAALTCAVRADGSSDCVVDLVTPIGWGFDEAAQAAAQRIHSGPTDCRGEPTAGRTFQTEFGWGYVATLCRDGLYRQPSWSELVALLPERTLQRNVSGTALLACVVGEGEEVSCVLREEAPEGYGFGRAALRASELMRATPVDCDGQPTAGRSFERRINWNLQ